MSNDKMPEAFEDWCIQNRPDLSLTCRAGGEYGNADTRKARQIWDAALTQQTENPVAFTGSGSLAAIKAGEEGYIWGAPAKAHPVALYLGPQPTPQVPESCALIPLDARYSNHTPKITNLMKSVCIGEFSFNIEVSEISESGEVTGEVVEQEVEVPWDTVKSIYKMMASVALLAAPSAPNKEEPTQ